MSVRSIIDVLSEMVIAHLPEAGFVLEPDGRLRYANVAAADLLGYSDLEFRSMNWTNIAPGCPLEPPTAAADSAPRSTRNGEVFITRKNGTSFPAVLWMTPLQADDRLFNLVCLRDQGPQERAEEALREMENRLRWATEAMPAMVQAFNSEMEIVFWNGECERVTGYGANEILGDDRAMERLFPDVDERERFIGEIARGGVDFRDQEFDLTCKDGTRRTISWFNVSHQVPIADWYYWVFGLDVTDRKQAEAALRDSQVRFKSAFDDAAIGMIIFSIDGRFLEVNAYMCRLLGYTEDELKAMRFHDLTHPSDCQICVETDREILEGEIPFGWVEKRYIRKDGQEVHVISSSSLVRDSDGRPLYFISHVQDITERRRAEEALREANTALKVLLNHREQEKVQLERDLVATVEKLVLPYVEKVQAGRLDDEQRTYLDIIRSNLIGITSPFAARLSTTDQRLSPAELEVADFLRHGKTTDEIAALLRVSPFTVSVHRRNIRKKLGLTNRDVNLKSYLRQQG